MVGTPIPMAELNFVSVGGTLTEAAAGQDQCAIIACNLPKGYAYIFAGAEMDIQEAEAGDIADWNLDWRSYLLNTGTAGGEQWLAGIKMTGDRAYNFSATLQGRIFKAQPISKVVIPVYDTDALYQVQGCNVTIDGGPMTLYFLATFLQFDLNQAHHWAMNTPIPVR